VEVNVPNIHMQQSEALFKEPSKFDGKRFLDLRSQPGNESRYQFVTTSPDSLGFGHGIHGCPGRFFAANEIKLMIVHLLMKFDWKFVDGKRPEHFLIADQTVLDHHVQVLYRSRVPEVSFV
jgi:cytochrome P450